MNRLKELRKEKKQTQKEFAKETGTPLRTLQSWENGESQIKPDKAQQLADYFGVEVGYLLGYSDEPVISLEDFVNQLDRYGTDKDGLIHLNKEQLTQALADSQQKDLRPLFIDNIKQNLKEMTDDDVALVHAMTERLTQNKQK